jgi:hypothetical protein
MNAWHRSSRLAFCSMLSAIAVPLLSLSQPVMSEEIRIILTGAEEVPPVSTPAQGTAVIIINEDHTVTGSAQTTGVEGTAAHIHAGQPGQNGPIIVPLVPSGPGKWSVQPGAKLTDQQYDAYKAGNLYVNVHSPKNKAGEIRGQLKPGGGGAGPGASKQ